MTLVADILKSKTDPMVYSIRPADSVLVALQLMADKGISAVLVMESAKVVGIFTERDAARKMDLMGRSAALTPVREVMTPDVMYVRPDQTSAQCMQLMSSRHLRHLPVLHEGQVVGMISIRDLVNDIISEQKFIIEQLEQYIAGAPR